MRGATTLLIIAVAVIPALAADVPGVREYEERCVAYYAQQYGVSAALVRAVIQVESAWRPGAVSSKGAMGLMQLMPATAQHFGVVHPFYVHENVRGGVAYLTELQQLFHGDLRLVMAAYAAGERQIRARGLSYASEEVYTYVQRIAQQYRAELRRSGSAIVGINRRAVGDERAPQERSSEPS